MALDLETLKKILFRFTLGLTITVGLYWISIPTESSVSAFIAFHSLLAFLAISSAALAFLVNFQESTPGRHIFFIALLYRVVIHMGLAIVYSFLIPDFSPSFAHARSLMDMQSLLVFGMLTFVSTGLEYRNYKGRINPYVSTPIILGFLLFYFFSFYYIIPNFTTDFVDTLIPVLGVFSGILFFISGIFILKLQNGNSIYSKSDLVAGVLAFLAAPFAIIANLWGFYSMWKMALLMQALGLSFIFLAIGGPLYRRSRIGKRATEAILGFLLTISLVPFALSVISEAYAPGILLPDIGAYLISHGTAALLAGMMSVLLFMYNKRRPSWNLLPLIVLYLSWTFIEIFIMLNFQMFTLQNNGESVVPYIMGAFVSLLVIYREIMLHTKPSNEDPTEKQLNWIGLRFGAVAIGVLGVAFIENRILDANPILIGAAPGRTVLLFMNLMALFGFSILLYMTARKYGDWKSIEGLSLVFLAFWIIPGILKGIFLDWTVGWWLGELVLLVAVGFGPPLLATLYVDSMSKALAAQRRATLYSDLLAHDITNMHQAILVALSLLELDEIDKESRALAFEDARKSLGRAADIVSNVRQIGRADQMGEDEMQSTDVVAVILDAFNQVKSEFPGDDIDFTVNSREGHCFVRANNLLLDLFYNLFKNAIVYSNDEKRIDVSIQHGPKNGEKYWRISVEDRGRGIEEVRKINLFQRFMKGAQGIGLGLSVVFALTKSFGGFIDVEDRVPGDHTKGTVFNVHLPMLQH
ncbi:MAG: ATP-binding protein [Candidatus Thorarchaeota archaeon]|nr:ATP-binding protein [Candidatus Thorarchaeota archaeon]